MGNFFFCDGRNVCFLFPFFFGWIYFRPNNVPHDVNDHLSLPLSLSFVHWMCLSCSHFTFHFSRIFLFCFFCSLFFPLFDWMNEKFFYFDYLFPPKKGCNCTHTHTHTLVIDLIPYNCDRMKYFIIMNFVFFWGENQTKKISPFSVKVSHCIIYIHQFICVFRCSN